jgi:hypothetical protein
LRDSAPRGGLLHDLQFVAQPLDLRLACHAAATEIVEFAAQRLVAGAHVGQRAAQADVVGFFLLQCAQRLVDRVDQLAEGILEVVEGADLAAGVDQKVAENLVFAPIEEPISAQLSTWRSSPLGPLPGVMVGAFSAAAATGPPLRVKNSDSELTRLTPHHCA